MYAASPHGATRLPQMDTFAQPADGAGGSRSRARARRPDSRPEW